MIFRNEDYYDRLLDKITKKHYLPIIDGKVQEKDIWHLVQESKTKLNIRKRANFIRRNFDVIETKYYYTNPKYDYCFLGDLAIYPFHVWDKYFATCQISHPIINEIVVSKQNLIFINSQYKGEDFILYYGSNPVSKELKLCSPQEMEGHKPTMSEIEIYNKIKTNFELFEKIHTVMHKSYAVFHLSSKKRRLTFKEYREFLSQHKHNLRQADKIFTEKEKNSFAIVDFFSSFPGSPIIKLEIKPEFFELAEDLLKITI